MIDRILKIIEIKNINKSQFYKKTGLSNGFLDKVKDVGASKLEYILNAFPDISPEWLLTGEGEMLKNTGNISISGNNTGIANTGIITGDVSSGNTISDSNITIERKTENNTGDISNLLDSYNTSKGVEIDRLQALYTTMLESKDTIIEEKNLLIQELKETIQGLKEQIQELREDKKHLKSLLENR